MARFHARPLGGKLHLGPYVVNLVWRLVNAVAREG
jgi:hypothetical protein